jgi:hypothetical protein
VRVEDGGRLVVSSVTLELGGLLRVEGGGRPMITFEGDRETSASIISYQSCQSTKQNIPSYSSLSLRATRIGPLMLDLPDNLGFALDMKTVSNLNDWKI